MKQGLLIEDLVVEVAGKRVVDGLNLHLPKGEVHAIMGPNGAGKSTLSYLLSGKPGYEVTSGTVKFRGRDLLAMPAEDRAREGVFLIMQYPVEIPGVPVTSFLKHAVNAVRKYHNQPELDTMEFVKMVREEGRKLGIDAEMLKRPVNVGFSGGEKKKAEILQMLMLEPKLAILDETDSGLDVDAVRTVSEGVRLFRERTHGSLLIITHSTRILEALHVDAAHVMEDGVIVRNGGAELVDEINEKGFGSLKED